MDNYRKIMDITTVQIDSRLDEYNNKILFPQKVEKAKATMSKLNLPQKKSKKNQPKPLSSLQKELLSIYSLEPTTQQMQELKDFMYKLFDKKLSELAH